MIEKRWVDRLYKYIEIDDETLKFINHPPIQKKFSRLSEISQLGLASRIFPSATHKKLDHNLGVYFLGDYLTKEASKSSDAIEDLSFKMAALIHGIGHFPFSLATEVALQKAAFLNSGVREFIDRKIQPVMDRILKNIDPKERKIFTKQVFEDRGRMNHFYRFFTSSLLLENERELRQIFKNVSGFNLDEILKYLCFPKHIGFKLLEHIDRLDYILRDMFHLGFISVDLNLSLYFANLKVKHDGEINFPSEWDVLNRFESYAVKKIYNEKLVKAAEALYQKIFTKAIFDSEIALSDLLEWGDIDLELRIKKYEDEKKHKYKLFEHINGIKGKSQELIAYDFSRHGEKITSKNSLLVEGRTKSIGASLRRDIDRAIETGIFKGSYPDSFDAVSGLHVNLVCLAKTEIQYFLIEIARYEKKYKISDKNQVARCIWGDHFAKIDFDRYKPVGACLYRKIQQEKRISPIQILSKFVLASPEYLPKGMNPTELSQMLITFFKLLERMGQNEYGELISNLITDRLFFDWFLTKPETALCDKKVLSSLGLSSQKELLSLVKPLCTKRIKRTKDFQGRALEYYIYLKKVCESEKRKDEIIKWVFPSTSTDRGEIDVWSLYIFESKKPLIELIECSNITSETEKLDAAKTLKQQRAILEERFHKKVEIRIFFNDTEISA